jgi:hypothetical protein
LKRNTELQQTEMDQGSHPSCLSAASSNKNAKEKLTPWSKLGRYVRIQ